MAASGHYEKEYRVIIWTDSVGRQIKKKNSEPAEQEGGEDQVLTNMYQRRGGRSIGPRIFEGENQVLSNVYQRGPEADEDDWGDDDI